MHINFDEIRIALNKIISKFNDLGVYTYEIKSDYYWDISAEEKYDNFEE